jgi:hypothetical protein
MDARDKPGHDELWYWTLIKSPDFVILVIPQQEHPKFVVNRERAAVTARALAPRRKGNT